MPSLKGKVALVTGGSRNVGKGISLGLGEAGATVYITGQTITDKVANKVSALGGQGIAIQCDHQHDDEVNVPLLIKSRWRNRSNRVWLYNWTHWQT